MCGELRGALHLHIGQLNKRNNLVDGSQRLFWRLGLIDGTAFNTHQQTRFVQKIYAVLMTDMAVAGPEHGNVIAAPNRLVGMEGFLNVTYFLFLKLKRSRYKSRR